MTSSNNHPVNFIALNSLSISKAYHVSYPGLQIRQSLDLWWRQPRRLQEEKWGSSRISDTWHIIAWSLWLCMTFSRLKSLRYCGRVAHLPAWHLRWEMARFPQLLVYCLKNRVSDNNAKDSMFQKNSQLSEAIMCHVELTSWMVRGLTHPYAGI